MYREKRVAGEKKPPGSVMLPGGFWMTRLRDQVASCWDRGSSYCRTVAADPQGIWLEGALREDRAQCSTSPILSPPLAGE